MNKQNSEGLQAEMEKKYKKRDKKKNPVMKISGAGVRDLQKIIKKRGN